MSRTRSAVLFNVLLATIAVPAFVTSLSEGRLRAAPPTAEPPASLELTGIVRDFKERTKPGGHPDFEVAPLGGFGHFSGNIAATLDADRKPVFTGGGFKVNAQWRDGAGRPICWRLFDAAKGDYAGTKGVTSSGGIQSAASFATWFNDDINLNVSKPLALTLVRQPNGSYVFDSQVDPAYTAVGGFFPIENQLFGNPGGTPNRNFHFTFELHTKFTYDADGGQVFGFRGDDDVWVFIDGKLVIDLGGVHGAIEQFVELNRLGLTDGEDYELSFFFAERHRTQSNFKITTNLQLETITLPSASNAFD
jgi:fibro-slime domain-containing protein